MVIDCAGSKDGEVESIDWFQVDRRFLSSVNGFWLWLVFDVPTVDHLRLFITQSLPSLPWFLIEMLIPL